MRIQAFIVNEGGKGVIEGVLHLASEQYEPAEGQEIIDVRDPSVIEEGYSYVDGTDDDGFSIVKRLPSPSAYHMKAQEEERKIAAEQEEILSLKRYLGDTDYVIAKLNELKLEDDESYETEKARYSDVLRKRKEARARLNELL